MDETNKPLPTAPEVGTTPAETPAKTVPVAVKSNTPPAEVATTSPPKEAVVEYESDPKAEPIATPPEAPAKKDFTPPKKPFNKKKWLTMLVVLIVIVALAFAAWSMLSKKSKNETNSSSSSNQTTIQSSNTNTPVTVAYAFKGADSSPFTLYTRPATGGDRTPADLKLDASEHASSGDVNGQSVVFSTEKGIYVSTDGGKSYKSIVKLVPNEQITSLKFADDGQSIVYGDLPTTAGKNTVKSISLDGTSGKTLLTSDKAGVFIIGYSSSKQKLVYREGCFNCDGSAGPLILSDLKNSKSSKYVTDTPELISDVAISQDFSKIVYATGSAAPADAALGAGVTGVAPYTVSSIDLASNKTTKITTFGTKNEKNANGTLRIRVVHAGFVAGTSTPYYTSDGQLYTIKSGSPSLAFESPKPILYATFVGTKSLIVGSGTQTADFALVNYDINSKKSTNIFSGDNNTIIFGVTTK